MLTLDVAISTYKPEGIRRVEQMLKPLQPKDGVRYVVSWQEHQNEEIPEYLTHRKDVEIHRLDLKGLSRNRNNAIDHCHGDIILIADDDLEYYPDFSIKIKKAFELKSEMDLGIFKVKFLTEKKYPADNCDLKLPFPKNYYCSSVEIAFRRERLKGMRFWSEMGLGNSHLQCGEDELFLISAIKKGFNCKFINEFIARHPEETTGDKISEGIIRAHGFIISQIYTFSLFPRLIVKAKRISVKNKLSFGRSLFLLIQGATYSLKYHERN